MLTSFHPTPLFRAVCALSLALVVLASPARLLGQDETASAKASKVKPQAVWYGEMDAGPRVFRFVIESEAGADGTQRFMLRSIDEGNQRFHLNPYRVEDDRFSFELKASNATYAGTLSDDGQTATGKWKQRAAEFDLVFRRVDEAPVDRPSELWVGTLNLVIQKLEIRIRVYEQGDNPPTVFLDSPTQKAGGFKAERTIDGANWTIKVPSLLATFTGECDADRTELDGEFEQNGLTFPLKLSRTDPQEAAAIPPPKRPQMPKPPFPYASEAVEFGGAGEQVRLHGTLTIPPGPGPHPAVILISGSGPQDRDETIFDHKPFWVLADHLSRRGIAVLRYDERGVGASTGEFDQATSETFAADVEAALDFLRQHDRIDAARIGLIGHSEGGLVAPMVAARRSEISAIVLLAGTGVTGEQILLSQGQLVLKAEGLGGEDELKLQRDLQAAIFRELKQAPADIDDEELLETILAKAKDLVSKEVFEDEQLEAKLRVGLAQANSPWFRFFLTYDPVPTLRRVKCPVLALNGALDVQVDAALNLSAIERALREGGNTQFKTVTLPGLNHLFQSTKTGAVSEYATNEETLSPRLLEPLTEWLQTRWGID